MKDPPMYTDCAFYIANVLFNNTLYSSNEDVK